jgi:hypothetical protein
MGEWQVSRGSRPAGLNDADLFEFERDGVRQGCYRADEFNWDLWCNYRPAQRDMAEGER